jgi:crotonobetainyl-CoA:carnitine CoA-transferase CaiB-like acyl-CoA transferase
VEKSDVFLTNFPRDVASRLKVNYETLSAHNPKLIYAIAHGYGSQGPWGNKRAFDPIGQALSGAMWMVGDRDAPEPYQIVGGFFDQLGATMVAYGILAALVARERTGVGQEIEASLLGSAIHQQAMNVNAIFFTGRSMFKHSQKRARQPLANHYKCADGKWIILAEPQSDRFWAQFCEAIGLPELKDDPRFDTALKRRQTYAELIPLLDKAFATKTRDEWIKYFEEKGYEFAYAPIYDPVEAVHSEQARANEYVTEFDHPELGRIKMIGFPVKFSKTPARIYREAPHLGQHTEEVLLELGYTWEEIAQFREEEVI